MKLKQKYFERRQAEVDTNVHEFGSSWNIVKPQECANEFVDRVTGFIRNRTDVISISYDNNFDCCVVVYEEK